MSGHDHVLRVPLVHLGHAAAQDLLAAAREGVGAGDGAAVDAPHMDVGAGTRHDVPLQPPHPHLGLLATIPLRLRDGTQTHRQLIDAQSRDGGAVAPELRDEGKFVQVPDDAGSIPGAADHYVVRR